MGPRASTTNGSGPQLATGAVVLGGRFRRDRLLKSSSGVETYAATDLEGGRRVILKRVSGEAVDDAVRLRLEHEADVLRQLKGLSFRSPVAITHDAEFVYMVKPYVPGITLEERLGRGPLSVTSTLRVGVDLLRSLELAHDNGVLHRDVKPANVIVGKQEPVERAVLIDFGFARSASLDISVRDERVGTARYLAPEAAGLLASAVDERSDLYSLGVLLFECLAGRPPFEADDIGSVLRQHLNTPAPPLRSLGIDVPRALDAAVQRLLRKDPAERYQTAGAAADDLEAVADGIARGVADPVVVIGLHDRRQALTEPSFVGRDAELAQLDVFIRRAKMGHGGLVLLEADSGGGKTRLLDELAQQSHPRAWILRGEAVDQGGQRPFQLLEGVVEGILGACHHDRELPAVLRRRLSDRAEAAVAALPGLAGVLGEAHAAHLGPEAYGETRSIKALSHLLDSLGSSDRPAVVILDDCQWADTPTLRLLQRWQEQVLHGSSNVVVIAAFRSEEVPPGHLLRSVPASESIALAPFGPDHVQALAESMAGPLPQEALETISSLAEGSPFMAAAVLRGLVEAEALVESPAGWQVDAERLAHVQTSRRAALFLVRRLELLSPSALDLLSVGAVLGKEFAIALATELCSQDEDATSAALEEAARRRMVWVDHATGTASFLHDKLREALLSRLSADDRRALHRRAALRLEEVGPSLFECRMRHHDGTWRDAETAISNLLDDPSVNGLVLNSRDITDRRRTERELLETLEREHDMRERLQEADRIKTDFVSAVSHELRTPFSSILGYLEMLEEDGSGTLDAEQARVLDVVDRNARRLLALIEDLLTISRVESGTFRLELEPVDIQSLVDAAHQAVLPSLAGRDLELLVDVGDETGSILGDAAHLDRLLINLLTNAIKFTPDGGRVALSAHRVDGAVVIEVSDTGIGIPLEEQANLFERFFRSSSARKLAVPGTGLGLSITKKVVEDHGGEISVSSVPGEGTTMTVRLPVTPAAGPGLAAA